MPGEEITNQNKIYFLEKGSKGQIEIDLIDLGLEIPPNGVFIGLEALGEFDEKTNLFSVDSTKAKEMKNVLTQFLKSFKERPFGEFIN